MSSLSQQYQKKTDKQHILDNPDTYIGSIENVDAELWVYDDVSQKIVLKHIEYIPGLYKLFDEGIVNCRDHVLRMIQSTVLDKKFVTYIDTLISEDGSITFENDGNGIDIAKHPEYDVWIPELVFGHLRTSTNYNKDEKRIVGGKNGFGFKLVLIWSTYGRVETVDHVRGLKYVQEFHQNLDKLDPPVITKVKSSKPYTRVTFRPDYARFGIPGLTEDMVALLKKRVYDIGAVTDHNVKKIKVQYNQQVIPVKNFPQYIDLYIGDKDAQKRVYEESDERWEYAVALSPTHEFIQISFVNGIATHKGGKHVDYIMGQLTRKLCDYIEKKKKIKVNMNSIKEQLILFLRCDVENPSFDSQTKDYMNTPSNKFGSSCTVSDAFVEKVAKMGVMDLACSLTEAKENRLAKKTDGAKVRNVRGIANFIDANLSGTAQSKDCILILCEGLSALSGIVSGLSSEDRNTIGIYPLKGKLLNVRGEQVKKIAENKEISDIKKILGLETGREYLNAEDVHANLRYGKVMYMTDQDLDGSHIKGLCINLFHSEWASLVKIPGFLSFMNTPILRAKKGSQTLLFYNDGEYHRWKESLDERGTHGWTIKYFKGLGTSTSAEFKEYFANKKIVDFVYNESSSDDMIDKIFNKKRADDRKEWLEQYDKKAFLDTNKPSVRYDDFINHEMIHFSTYDCARSIPNMVDGLKTSLRKILFCAFKRRLTTEIKVAQFSGYISEHSAYHHGEASLNGAIVSMAQNYVGSNNVNLLEPHGQFGCLDPDTPVLLWDGSQRLAKDIQVEDLLMGDDGQPRKVLRTTHGVDDMYELCDCDGMSVKVNSQHILTLYFPKNMEIMWKDSAWLMLYFDGTAIVQKSMELTDTLTKEDAYEQMIAFQQSKIETYSSNKIIDIKVLEYLALSDTLQKKVWTVNTSSESTYYKRFSVQYVGKGEFCGWSVDGNERFVLGNYMVTHNSRLQGGDDSASERYIFTLLSPLARALFPETDDAILNYLDDDGTQVEPDYYVPIIPFALINGISGIGTGFSCNIPSYNPLEIIHGLKERLSHGQFKPHDFIPFYEGFKGTVRKIAEHKYLIKGCYEKIGEDSIRITELPIGTWTMPYITFLEGLMDGVTDKSGKKIPSTIRDFTSICTEVAIHIVVTFPRGKLSELEGAKETEEINGVEKLLKLTTTVSTTNIHMFNKDFKLHKYTSIEEILGEFYDVRYATYQKRKDYLMDNMQKWLKKLSNRARYILAVLDGSVDLRKKTNEEVTALLGTQSYDMLEGDYKYLTKMPMDSVTNENVQHILKEKEDTEKEWAILRGTSVETIWLRELEVLETEYMKYKTYREKIQNVGSNKDAKKSAVVKKAKK